MQNNLQIYGNKINTLSRIAHDTPDHSGEEAGMFRLLRVPLVLIERVLQLQRQTIVILPHYI